MRMRALQADVTRESGAPHRSTDPKSKPTQEPRAALRANAQQTEHQRRRHKAVEEDQGEEKSGGKMERSERSERSERRKRESES